MGREQSCIVCIIWLIKIAVYQYPSFPQPDKNRSTSVNNANLSTLPFVDISKAFDSINHISETILFQQMIHQVKALILLSPL